jgi:hypothetical protein
MKRVAIALLLFAVALTFYLVNYQYRFWAAGGDTTPAELLPLALMRNHDLVFDGLEGPGPLPSYWQRSRGHIISAYPIIPGLFNVPAYFIAAKRGIPLDQEHRSLLSMISAGVVTAISVFFFFLAVSRLVKHEKTAIGATIIYAFGTTVASVAARGMWQHGPSLLFLTIALWLIARDDARSLALSALPLGFAVFNRPVNILIVLPLAAYVLWRNRRAFIAFCAIAAIPAALLAWYSSHYWGSLTSLGQYSAGDLFTNPLGAGILGLLFSPERGLFVFTPVFLFAAVFMAVVLRHPSRDPLLTALSIGVIAMLLLLSAWYSWWGGSCFGYRLLTECVPALTILLAVGWERILSRNAFAVAATAVLALASIYVNFVGAFYYPWNVPSAVHNVNEHPELLWDARDGDIARCSARFFDRVRGHLSR